MNLLILLSTLLATEHATAQTLTGPECQKVFKCLKSNNGKTCGEMLGRNGLANGQFVDGRTIVDAIDCVNAACETYKCEQEAQRIGRQLQPR